MIKIEGMIQEDVKYERENFTALATGGYFKSNKTKLPAGEFYKKVAEDILAYLPVVCSDELYIYDEKTKKFKFADELIRKYIIENYTAMATTRNCAEIIHTLTHLISKNTLKKNVIYLKNGVFDFDEWRFIPSEDPLFGEYTRLYYAPTINVAYNPSAECKKIDKFIREIVDEKNIPLLYEFIGYSVYPDIFLNEFLILHGSGANGKSTFLNMLSEFLGRENVANISLQNIEENRFHSHTLVGKLINIYSDLPADSIRSISTLKALTGGDEILVEQKFKNPFKYKNRAKLIFACNQIPLIHEESDAFYRRIIIVDFPNQFLGERANPQILNEITTEEELSGLFNEALKHLDRLLKFKRFSYTHDINERREIYIRRTEPIKFFIEEEIEKAHNEQIPKSTIFKAFVSFAEKNKLKTAINEKMFWKKFKRVCEIEYTETKPFRSERLICGLRLKGMREKQDTINFEREEEEGDEILRGGYATSKHKVLVRLKKDIPVRIRSYIDGEYGPAKIGDTLEVYLYDAQILFRREFAELLI